MTKPIPLDFDPVARVYYVPAPHTLSAGYYQRLGWVTPLAAGLPATPAAYAPLLRAGAFLTPDLWLAASMFEGATPRARAAMKEALRWSFDPSAPDNFTPHVPVGVTLRPYQARGVYEILNRPQKRVLLADDMGLGKSAQSIVIANHDLELNSILIVCPATLRLNWAREWAMFSTRQDLTLYQVEDWIAAGKPARGAVIINYDRLIKHADDLDVVWDYVILDEAHAVKNRKSQRAKAVFGGHVEYKPQGKAKVKRKVPGLLKAARRVVMMTGTPVLRSPVDLHPLLQALDSERWGYKFFTEEHCEFIYSGTSQALDPKGAKNLGGLNVRLRSAYMIRRLKADVLKEIPPKVRRLVPVEITGRATTGAAEMIRAHAAQTARDDLRTVDGGRAMYDAELARVEGGGGDLSISLGAERARIGEAKVPQVVAHVRAALDADDGPVIVFAHHVAVVDALLAAFADVGAVKVVGGMSAEAKQASVDAFQSGAARVLVGNIQAAGVGITLTRSAHVVFAELDWTPALLEQAEDRACRIGQRSSVTCDYLFAPRTLDAYMMGAILRKREQSKVTLDGGTDETHIDATDDTIKALNALTGCGGDYAAALHAAMKGRETYSRAHLQLVLAAIRAARSV